MAIQCQRMVGNLKTMLLSNFNLTFLNFGIEEFFDLAAIQTHQMVMVRAFIELENGLASFEMIALQQTGLLELGQYPVDGCQTDI